MIKNIMFFMKTTLFATFNNGTMLTISLNVEQPLMKCSKGSPIGESPDIGEGRKHCFAITGPTLKSAQ